MNFLFPMSASQLTSPLPFLSFPLCSSISHRSTYEQSELDVASLVAYIRRDFAQSETVLCCRMTLCRGFRWRFKKITIYDIENIVRYQVCGLTKNLPLGAIAPIFWGFWCRQQISGPRLCLQYTVYSPTSFFFLFSHKSNVSLHKTQTLMLFIGPHNILADLY